MDPELLTAIQKKIVHIMANQLEQGKVTEAEMSEIAEFVLERSDGLTEMDQLILLLKHLSERWPMFHDLYIIEAGRIKEAEAEQKINDALNLTREGKIDEALQVAKDATY
jgi:hypothetical protein